MSGRHDDLAGIPLRQALAPDARAEPWSVRLLAFVRVAAVLQFAKGLLHWSDLIGVGAAGDPFAGVSTGAQVATVLFAVADLVAAVGLWLGAAWGVVMWLLAVIGQIVVSSMVPDALGAHWIVTAGEATAMLAYLALSLKARAARPA